MRKLLLYLFINISILGLCQNPGTEQLNSELKIAKEDSVKIKILHKLGWQIHDTEPEMALKYFLESLEISRAINDTKKIGKSLTYIGIIYHQQSKYNLALRYHLEALKIAEQLKNKSLLANSYMNLGSDYEGLGNFNSALSCALSAIKLYEEIGNIKGMAGTYNNIGYSNYIQKQYATSIKYFEAALKLYLQLKDTAHAVFIYDNLASANYELNNYELNKKYCIQALELRKRLKDTLGLPHTHMNLAIAYYGLKNYPMAIQNNLIALNAFKLENNMALTSHVSINLAAVYFDLGDYRNARLNLDEGFRLGKSCGEFQRILSSYKLYALLFAKTGEYKKAYEYHVLETKLNDSLFYSEKNKQMLELQTKYETEKKEKEIGELTFKSKELWQQNQIQQLKLSRNRYLIFGLGSLAILIIVVSLLLISRNKLKASQAKMEVEQKLFRSQMNPHFIFNSLIAIQNYVYKHEPSEVAGYISNFAKLMRMILENSRNETVSIEKELNMLKYYLDLQKLRFPEKFDFVIDVDPTIDVEAISIPPMLSQPFIENAIEHGIMNKTDGKGNISIKFVQKHNLVEMRIMDNGVGRDALTNSAGANSKHQSLATIITNERLLILNKKSKVKFTLEILDLKSNEGKAIGTEVIICMPEK